MCSSDEILSCLNDPQRLADLLKENSQSSLPDSIFIHIAKHFLSQPISIEGLAVQRNLYGRSRTTLLDECELDLLLMNIKECINSNSEHLIKPFLQYLHNINRLLPNNFRDIAYLCVLILLPYNHKNINACILCAYLEMNTSDNTRFDLIINGLYENEDEEEDNPWIDQLKTKLIEKDNQWLRKYYFEHIYTKEFLHAIDTYDMENILNIQAIKHDFKEEHPSKIEKIDLTQISSLDDLHSKLSSYIINDIPKQSINESSLYHLFSSITNYPYDIHLLFTCSLISIIKPDNYSLSDLQLFRRLVHLINNYYINQQDLLDDNRYRLLTVFLVAKLICEVHRRRSKSEHEWYCLYRDVPKQYPLPTSDLFADLLCLLAALCYNHIDCQNQVRQVSGTIEAILSMTQIDLNQPKAQACVAWMNKKIQKLDETVVNRIAAGEIVVRPCAAIKELVENCLDAGAHTIQIHVKQGGLKSIEIRDDGCGISKVDLPLVCERFATSKLKNFDDLYHLNTYGFRGEALASLSYAGHVKIISKIAESQCAYICEYEDGKIRPSTSIKPCAGTNGTLIIIEDLFYNNPIRLKMIKSPSEEYTRMVDCVMKMALRNIHVSFSLKRDSQIEPDVHTNGKEATTILHNMKMLYGADMVKDMYEIMINLDDTPYKFQCKACFTGTQYSSSSKSSSNSMTFILFINGRLVDCQPLKKSIQQMYAVLINKQTSPFVYLDLIMDPTTLDVNIHPSKNEIRFLHADPIIVAIVQAIEQIIVAKSAKQTTTTTQLTFHMTPTSMTLVPPTPKDSTEIDPKPKKTSLNTTVSNEKKANPSSDPSRTVRTSSRDQKLDKHRYHNTSVSIPKKSTIPTSMISPLASIVFPRQIKLTSIELLRQSVEEECDTDLLNIIRNFVYVGTIDGQSSLIQHDTQLYLIHTRHLSQELFYQLCLYHFGNMGTIRLEPEPPAIDELIRLETDNEEIIEYVIDLLKERHEMLEDYFSLRISSTDPIRLETLPILLDTYVPNLDYLPQYLLRLSKEVNWTDERECFRTFADELSKFYSYRMHIYSEEDGDTEEKQHWAIEHLLYHAFKTMLVPSKHLRQAFVKLTEVQQLYKVFERC
ncbi:unnamed protein product [Adineta steineri]|uniref:DNA mismatch repair protein S5 domain-containing protein n=1 Tax=Adineta steineri TaxID=433720 RepID=A0A814YYJ2_9BILA|nr:unnamed protein product [Adineta steineri]CAF3703150.1 unnamed protein product [Adineta steineri]